MPTELKAVTRHIEIEQGSGFTFARRLYHHTLAGSQVLFDTSGYSALFTVRSPDWTGDIVVTATEADYITLGYTPAPWEATTAYGLGQYVVPTELNGFVYECTTAGTSDSGEPTWPTSISATVNDDSAVWTCASTDSWVANVYLYLPSTYTEGLTDWGAGVYTLELEDSFGNVQRLYEGSARLSLEASYS